MPLNVIDGNRQPEDVFAEEEARRFESFITTRNYRAGCHGCLRYLLHVDCARSCCLMYCGYDARISF